MEKRNNMPAFMSHPREVEVYSPLERVKREEVFPPALIEDDAVRVSPADILKLRQQGDAGLRLVMQNLSQKVKG